MELKNRGWRSQHSLTASKKHPRPRPTHWGSIRHHQTVVRSVEELPSTDWYDHSPEPSHRRWKRLRGSPIHRQPATTGQASTFHTTPLYSDLHSTVVTSNTASVPSASSIACTTIDPFVGDIPSAKDNATGGFFRFECGLSPQLAYECPYLCGYDVGKEMGECHDEDKSTQPAEENGMAYSCTHCFYPSRKIIASSTDNTPTCTSIDPLNPACPASVRFSDTDPSIRYQTACGTTTSDIQDCPFLCTAIDDPDQYHCEGEDVSGTTFPPAGLIQACVQCLPACDAGE